MKTVCEWNNKMRVLSHETHIPARPKLMTGSSPGTKYGGSRYREKRSSHASLSLSPKWYKVSRDESERGHRLIIIVVLVQSNAKLRFSVKFVHIPQSLIHIQLLTTCWKYFCVYNFLYLVAIPKFFNNQNFLNYVIHFFSLFQCGSSHFVTKKERENDLILTDNKT